MRKEYIGLLFLWMISVAWAQDSVSVDSSLGKDSSDYYELKRSRVVAKVNKQHREYQISKQELDMAEVRNISAAQGDPLRVINTLPGIHRENDASVRPFIRGGSDEETRVLFQGVPLANPWHIGSIYSIMNTEMVQSLQVWSSSFPAYYATGNSGLILFEKRMPSLDSLELVLDYSMLRSNNYISYPLIKKKLVLDASLQHFWYDDVLRGGWWITDKIKRDKDFSDQRKSFEKKLDLPDFTDWQFGVAYIPTPSCTLQYHAIFSEDSYLYREDRYRFYVNGQMVPERYMTFYNVALNREEDQREVKVVYDSVVAVETPSQVHVMQYNQRLGKDLSWENKISYQYQNWIVKNVDDEVWEYSVDSNGNFNGSYSRTSNRHMKLKQSDLFFSSTLEGFVEDRHHWFLGFDGEYRFTEFDTKLSRSLYDLIVGMNMTGNTLVSNYHPDNVLSLLDYVIDPYANYYKNYVNRIRHDFRGNTENNVYSIFFQDDWDINSSQRLIMGLRETYHHQSKSWITGPSLNWIKELSPQWELSLATGYYVQPSVSWYVSETNPDIELPKTWHSSIAMQYKLNDQFKFGMEMWAKKFDDLVVNYLDSSSAITWGEDMDYYYDSIAYVELDSVSRSKYESLIGDRYFRYSNQGEGRAMGLETSVEYQPWKSWKGRFSFEYGFSKRKDSSAGDWYDYQSFRPWKFIWMNEWDLKGNFSFSTRMNYSAGFAYTPVKTATYYQEESADFSSERDTLFALGAKNSKRYAPYVRLDLRLSRTTTLWKHPAMWYVEIWNAMNSGNYLLRDSETKKIEKYDLNYMIPVFFFGLRWTL